MIDFSYAGRRLSDYGYIIAYVNTSLSDSVSLGSEIKFETIKNKATHVNRIIEADYNEPTSITVDICKNPCINEELKFSDTEISHIMSWLNKKRYEKFCPIYDDSSYPEIYFKGSFNVSAIYVNGNVMGFTLTFTPNAPYGFESEKTVYYSVEKNESFEFYNNSDEYGYLYPTKFAITCNEEGNLEISNSIDARNIVKINNCTSGEIITLDCQNKIIQTNCESHSSICKDFNYNFPRFVANEHENKNVFTMSIPCKIAITYSLIRKAGIIV
jgi:hypothetical protein